MSRVDPPWTGPEQPALVAWLQYHRDTLAAKCEGLTAEQMCERSVPPSTMSLIGLVRHMTEVERNWFRRLIAGESDDIAGPLYYDDMNEDGDFDDVDTAHVERDVLAWHDEIAYVDAIIAAADLDSTRFHPRREIDISVRWVMLHMIEEYARHNGHADFLRERIDGTTGE